ncbi:hypothetical protein BATDEDRAFT_9936 [Batrachochytrium dendrobatidis JAM81]|uniref:Vacuolar protein sorting-associated protein 29 n=1 Tax=Batrachochytrium dendrobatidis (strain JAM81 / FGSC 10211) TaxID=684364 RepID=F4NYF1_BATDJ|nr:retromer subunit VPS29 [Batrachochytrium dendrobatidis JAM81]EGF82008.1 hypothetical protein BATDEDRAFT_9936 [Batrachochytrium dendrobatidis JAM81]|eukprot:XP_006677121.1 hypothetical protein BATDEDRAFT_9936 [Batrachochytrium dendrobatidis JAM81]
MLVLLIGDFHVPHRKIDLPARFKKLLVPGKIQQILSTGNLTSTDMYDYLRTIAPNVVTVRGDMDEFLPGSGSGSAATHGLIRIGLLHGHQLLPWGDVQALGIAARQLDVDVLVSGHTHEFAAYEYEGRFFVNPGSATGAFSLTTLVETTPSFVLMDIQGTSIVLYVYKLIDGEVKVEKLDYEKSLDITNPI